MKKEGISYIRISVLTALAISLCTGCASSTARMYSGRELPRSEIAIIRNDAKILVLSVDKSRLIENTTFRKYARPSIIELLPGKHTIVIARKIPKSAFQNVKYRSIHTQRIEERKVTITVEAGHTYITTEEVQTSPFFKWTPRLVEASSQ